MSRFEIPDWLQQPIGQCVEAIDRGGLKEDEAVHSLTATIMAHQDYVKEILVKPHAHDLIYAALRAKPKPEPETSPASTSEDSAPPPEPLTNEELQGVLFPTLRPRVRVTIKNYRPTLRLDADELDKSHKILIRQLEAGRRGALDQGLATARKRINKKYDAMIEDEEVFYEVFRRSIQPGEVVEDVINRLGEDKIRKITAAARARLNP